MAMTWLQLFLDVPRARWEESLRFWSAATGWAVSPARGEDDQFVTLLPPHGTPWVKLQAIDTDARIHLDLDSRDRDGEIDRALAAGARPAWVYEDVTVMRSPGGLLFCHTLAGPERPTLHRGDDDLVLDQVCLDVPGRLWEAEVAFWATMTGRTPRAIVRTRSSGTAATTTRSSRSALTSSWTGSSGCTGPRPRPHSPPAESDGTWGTEGSWGHGHSAPTGELVGHARPAPGSATHNYPLPPGAALR